MALSCLRVYICQITQRAPMRHRATVETIIDRTSRSRSPQRCNVRAAALDCVDMIGETLKRLVRLFAIVAFLVANLVAQKHAQDSRRANLRARALVGTTADSRTLRPIESVTCRARTPRKSQKSARVGEVWLTCWSQSWRSAESVRDRAIATAPRGSHHASARGRGGANTLLSPQWLAEHCEASAIDGS